MDTLAMEARFLSGHHAGWVPVFATRTRDADPVWFYGALLDLIHSFVVHEADFVRLIVKRGAAV
jgi:TorA maturation chaperone TorD